MKIQKNFQVVQPLIPEIVPNNKVGLVVEPNEQEVGDAILKFYDENKEAVFLQHILEEKKKYSWQVMVEKIKSLIAKK